MNSPLFHDCNHGLIQTLGSEGAVWFWIALIATTFWDGIADLTIISTILKRLNNWLDLCIAGQMPPFTSVP